MDSMEGMMEPTQPMLGWLLWPLRWGVAAAHAGLWLLVQLRPLRLWRCTRQRLWLDKGLDSLRLVPFESSTSSTTPHRRFGVPVRRPGLLLSCLGLARLAPLAVMLSHALHVARLVLPCPVLHQILH